MKKVLLLIPFLFTAFVYGQTLAPPIDFESTTVSYTFTDFNGGVATVISNPDMSGINTSSMVGQMVKGAGEVWGGSYLEMTNPIDFSNSTTFTVKVWSPRVGANLLLKVENSNDPNIFVEEEVASTVANAWEELSFDMSAVDMNNDYQKIVLIWDNGTAGDGSANFTFYFDDISLGNVATGTVAPQAFEGLKYYPNPVNDLLSISSQESITGVQVYDLLGKEVLNIAPGVQNPQIDMQSLNTGAYIVRVSSKDAVKNFRIVKN